MRPRSALIAPLLVVLAALVLSQYTRVWLSSPPALARTSDFAGTYAAATLWREGQAANLYDSQAEQRVLASTGTPSDHLDIPFENPPVAAVLGAPFSLLDAATAYRAWSLLQLLMVIAAVVVATRAAPWPKALPRAGRVAVALVALAGFGTAALWVEGQWDGPAVLGIALAYAAWRRDRPLAAGVAIGITAALAKPHLAIGLAAFMLGRREWRALGGALGGALATVVAGMVTMGAAPLLQFAHALSQPAYNPSVQMQGLTGLFASWLGSGGAVYAGSLLLSAVAVVLAVPLGVLSRERSRLEPALGGATALSLLAAPHLLSHDLTLLTPLLVALCAWLASRERAWPGWATLCALGLWVLLSVASQHDLGNAQPAPPGRLTPWPLLMMATACIVLTLRGAGGLRLGSAVFHVANQPPRAAAS